MVAVVNKLNVTGTEISLHTFFIDLIKTGSFGLCGSGKHTVGLIAIEYTGRIAYL